MRVLVTGGSGGVGRWVVKDLVDHGYEVVYADWVRATPPNGDPTAGALAASHFVAVDMLNIRQVAHALEGCEGVVHLAAYPTPLGRPAEETFSNNTRATFHVLQAAMERGIQRAVIASSVSALGMAYARHPFAPLYAPIDEEHPFLGQEAYALSKQVDEATAAMFYRRAGMDIAALRFHWVTQPGQARDAALRPNHPIARMHNNLWGYVDVRDAAAACRLALASSGLGFQAYNILAADTLRQEPTEDALRRFVPSVEIRAPMPGFTSAWSIDKARRLMGYQPQHSWRTE